MPAVLQTPHSSLLDQRLRRSRDPWRGARQGNVKANAPAVRPFSISRGEACGTGQSGGIIRTAGSNRHASNDWDRPDDASQAGHSCQDRYHSRRATQSSTVSRPKYVAPGWWRSYLGSGRGPEIGRFLSLTPVPPWPRLRSGFGCSARWVYRTRHSVNTTTASTKFRARFSDCQ